MAPTKKLLVVTRPQIPINEAVISTEASGYRSMHMVSMQFSGHECS
jgi:hypothetical protein